MVQLQRPLLVEGPPGVGKTELAKVLAQTTEAQLIRLQCYEGLDEAKALYEWEYSKQLLYVQMLKEQLGTLAGHHHLPRRRRGAVAAPGERVFLAPFFTAPAAAAGHCLARAHGAIDR